MALRLAVNAASPKLFYYILSMSVIQLTAIVIYYQVSKAAMLSKTAEYAQKLKTERQQMQKEAEMLQAEIDALNSAIRQEGRDLAVTRALVQNVRVGANMGLL